MRRERSNRWRLPLGVRFAAGLGVLLSYGCEGAGEGSRPNLAAPSIESAGSTLQLVVLRETATEIDVGVGYVRRPEQAGPRVVEIMLAVGEALTLAGAEPLDAARAAGKEVVAQPLTQPHNGGVRLLLYSTGGLERLDSGMLALLRFRRAAGEPVEISLLNPGSTFAPAEANAGFVPPPALQIGGS